MADCKFRNVRNKREIHIARRREKQWYGERSWSKFAGHQELFREFMDDVGNVVVAEIEGQIAGFYVVTAYASRDDPTTMHGQLARFAIHPELRRRQIGTHMLINACIRGVHSEFTNFHCFIDEDDLPGQLFMRANGWKCNRISTTESMGIRYRFNWDREDWIKRAPGYQVILEGPTT